MFLMPKRWNPPVYCTAFPSSSLCQCGDVSSTKDNDGPVSQRCVMHCSGRAKKPGCGQPLFFRDSVISKDQIAMGQNQRYHFWVGAPPILVYLSWDLDVHWGYGTLTHGQLCSGLELFRVPKLELVPCSVSCVSFQAFR